MNINKILSKIYDDFWHIKSQKVDSELIRYFKNEFGQSWELELDKYLIRNEVQND